MGAKPAARISKPTPPLVWRHARSPQLYCSVAFSALNANFPPAAKYKEYNRLRNILSGKYPATPQPQSEPPRPRHNQQQQRKRKSHADIPTTPSKRLAAAANTAVTVSLPHSTPSSTKPTPTRLPQVIGPTPQKDGLVLGLFDLLPPAETPSREGARRRTALTDIEANGSNAVVAQTPRKEALQPEGGARGSRTPMSAGKRAFLDRFATPMKAGRGRGEGSRDGDRERKVHSTTPVFLRRDGVGLELVEEEDVDGRARRRPFGRKGLVRSLSSMIQRARQQEEERLDEELDILREMEAEVAGSGPAKRDVPKILIQDSQALEMPLGPDGTVESEEDEQDAAATDKARKLWKKRGQKRQTRRFIRAFTTCHFHAYLMLIVPQCVLCIRSQNPSLGWKTPHQRMMRLARTGWVSPRLP